MNFLAKLFSFFSSSKSKKRSKSSQLKLMLIHADEEERSGDLNKALELYQEAMNELETSLKSKMEEKYYRSKYSEIRFNIDKLKRQIDDSIGQIINFPIDPNKS